MNARSLLVILALSAAACASTPRPRVLGAVDAARASSAVTEAQSGAPQAHARAEALARSAEQAHEAGDPARAQILGEQALAAYQRAVALDHLRRAELRVRAAEAREAELVRQKRLEEEAYQKLDAQARALELRLKVARETLPVPASEPSSPERMKARLEAARALATEARLLCSAARLLDPKRSELAAVFTRLDTLDQRVAQGANDALDQARGLRSECLRELTLTRRPATQSAPAAAAADTLLTSLSNASLEPSRDDRGVVVTIARPFGRGDALSEPAKQRLAELGQVAKLNPRFPVQVVVHSGQKLSKARESARADGVAGALRDGGAPSVEAHAVGTTLPRFDPARPGAREGNDRVEIVFVAPSAG